jgi:hypothetical protein
LATPWEVWRLATPWEVFHKGNSDQDVLEERDSYGNLGTVDADLIGSRPWLDDACKQARKDAKKARNDDMYASNPEVAAKESLIEQNFDIDNAGNCRLIRTADQINS